jgi:PAS domain S-box-containing protein
MGRLLGTEGIETLKELIRELHEGADPETAKEKLKRALTGAIPVEIAQAEEELIREGMPREEVHRLCEVHLAVFRESLENAKPLAPAGHPIHILMEEHKIVLQFAAELKAIAQRLRGTDSVESASLEQLERLAGNLRDSESHYVREENVLFPYLERHGVTQPPAIMWMEHDQIREAEKSLYGLINAHETVEFHAFAGQLDAVASALAELLANHFHKENNVLFPVSVRVMTEGEWREAKRQFDELGYSRFTPKEAKQPAEEEEREELMPKPTVAGRVSFETGALSTEELEAVLNALPVDITFVDREDTVRYFNQSKERIFPRTRAVIGRKVQQCHPEKSVHIVNRILEEFRGGRRDVAEFWISYQGMLAHIRYFAVRGRDGEYLGTLEVTQDIMSIKQLEGEKRLLDEVKPDDE